MRYLCASLLIVLAGCSRQGPALSHGRGGDRVTVYCSIDQRYAKPVIVLLQKQTGLHIDVVYDKEAKESAGLVDRIRAEGNHPRGDVFWNSSLLQTLLLEEEEKLEPYTSPFANDIPAALKSKCWASSGVRSRVIVWHKGLPNPPHSYADLVQPRFSEAIGISNPQFGTASDELAAVGSRLGEADTLLWYRGLKINRAKILPGNSVVARKVAAGQLLVGVTDTDDYLRQKQKGGAIVAGNMHLLAVPQSVAILKNAPHLDAAKRLVDALLAPETIAALCKAMPGVSPTHAVAGAPAAFDLVHAPVDTARWARRWRALREPVPDMLTATARPAKR